MNLEEKCIARTREYESKQIAEEAKLYEGILNPSWNPFEGFITDFTWESSLTGKIKQCLLLPLIIPFVIIVFLVIPFVFMLDYIYGIKRRRLKSKEEAKKTDKDTPYVVKSPIEKTIYSLWTENGSAFGGLNSFDKLDLLCEWVDFLYGEHTSNRLKLRRRGLKIRQEQLEAQRKLTQEYDDSNFPHSLLEFVQTGTAEVLAKEISNELPHYDLSFSETTSKAQEEFVDGLLKQIHHDIKA
jgi:hypothetical protein